MKKILLKQFSIVFLLLVFLLPQNAFAQLTGTKTIPGDYATIEAAITALNTQGVGTGGVTFDVAANHTETFTRDSAGHITATGTVSDPIVFQMSGTGSNPLITASGLGTIASSTTNGSNGDGIIFIEGGDYITFDGIDLQENVAATVNQFMEYGIYLKKAAVTVQPDTADDACKNITIKNCTITLDKATRYSYGIYVSNRIGSNDAVVTSIGGRSENIKIYSNSISDCYGAIQLRGDYQSSTTGNFDFYDQNIEIGVDGGNQISDFGGGGSSCYPIYAIYQDNLKIANNTINGGAGQTSTMYGIYCSSAYNSNLDIYANTLTITSAATSSSFYGIYNTTGASGTDNIVNIYDNIIENCATSSTTSSYKMIYSSASANTVNIYGNIIRNNSRTGGGSGSMYLLDQYSTAANGTENVYDNEIYNNTNGTGSLYCLRSYPVSTTTKYIYGNDIYSNSGGGYAYGLYSSSGSTVNIYQNNVYDITGGSTVYGLYKSSGVTINVYENNIYDIESTTTSTSVCYGIYSSTGTDVYYYNNFLSDIKATNSTSTTAGTRGFYISSGTNVGLYYNTVYLDYTGAATNNSAAFYASTSTTSLDLRNNIFVNNVDNSAGGTAFAFRGSGTAVLTDLAATTNNNLYYAGTPSATNLIYYDGTNTAQTLSAYQTLASPKESASISENPPFVNSTVTPYDLHMNTTIATQTESGGTPVTTPIAVTTDYDGDTRNATTPDIGADEFAGIGADLTAPLIAYTLLPNADYTATSVSLTANITDASGVASGTNLPRLYIKKTTDVSYVFDNNPSISVDDYTFTINYTAISGISVGDTIEYYVAAQDIPGNAGTNPAGGSGSSPPGTTPPTTPNTYIIVDLPMSGTYTVGLTEFMRITGKQVYFETRTRTVTKNINGVDAVEDINTVDGETKTEILNPDLSPRYVTVTETYQELMENGKPFDTNFFLENPDAVYPTITAAVNDLNLRGMSGAVTFSLVDTYYPSETYPILIGAVNGASVSNTITIKPASGITTEIPGDVAQTAATIQVGYGNWVIIDGSNTVSGTTKDLKIVGLAAGTFPAIHLWGDASNNVFKNLILESQNPSTGSGTFLFGSGPFASDNNVVENCIVQNIDTIAIRNGVAFYFFSTNTGTGNQFINCSAVDFDDYGFRLQGAPTVNTLVSGCEVYMTDAVSTSSTYGAYVSRVEGLIIEKSKFYNFVGGTVRGIYILGNSTSGDFTIRNNFISLAASADNSGTLSGLDYYGYAANSFEAYHNSIYFGGTDVTGSSTTYALTKRDDANIYKAYNNAVHTARSNGTGTGTHYAVYVSDTNTVTLEMDYNDYFADGTGGTMGYYQGTGAIADLSTWKTTTGMDANSLSADPGFIGNDDLHIKTFISTLDGMGMYFASVPDDIDGDTRNVTTPDIGADEYTYVPPSVLDPTDVTATAISFDQIDVGFTPNVSTDNVVIVYNLTGTFTTPSGTPPAPGNPFAGGTLIANTTTSPYNHTGLTELTQYYYKLFSYDGVNYSFGVTANATTPLAPISTFPYVEAFENGGSIPAGWMQDITNTEDWLFKNTAIGHGAPADHTTGAGYYAGIDDSSPHNAHPSGLISPYMDLTALTTPIASFYYWIGDGQSYPSYLNIDVFDGTVWVDSVITALVENNMWSNITLDLTPYKSANTKFRFNAFEDLVSYNADICIDDFKVEEAPTTPLFSITPDSYDYGTVLAGNVISQDFTISNVGVGTLTINSGGITLGGSNPGEFTLGSITYPILLGIGESTDITVSFTPTTAGDKSADLQIVHNAPGTPAVVPLTGTALPAGILFEDFTTTTFPPPGWTVANQDSGGQTWQRYATSPYFLSPPASAACRWESSILQNDDWLITPKLVVTSGDSLVFWWRAYSATWTESMVIKVGSTNDPAGTWTDIDSLASNNPDWMRQMYDLSAYAGEVYVAFVYRGLNEFRIYMDDVMGPQLYVPAVDLAFTDFYQATGLPPIQLDEMLYESKVSRYVEPVNEKEKYEAPLQINSNGVQSNIVERVNPISYGGNIPFNPELLNNVDVKAVIENYGLNAASYDLDWTVGEVVQTTYNGPSVPSGDSDTATVTYTPTDRGTFLTDGSITVTADENPANNDATPFYMRVYPDDFTQTFYDDGNMYQDTWVGWGTTYPTERMKAGVRFTAPSNDIKLAGVDFLCRTETTTGGTWEIQVRDTSDTTGAPGAVLYEIIITDTVNYYSAEGAMIHFAFDDTAPVIPAGEEYWITIKAPRYILYPGGVDNDTITLGHSYYEQFSDTTSWTPLVITTERSWIMRSVEVAAGGTTFPLSVTVMNDWNMVSIPGLHPTNQNVATWWSNLTGSVFKFDNGYVEVITVEPGEGYWMKNSGAETYNYTDIQIVTHDPIDVVAEWNMIGGYENIAPVSGLIPSVGTIISVFEFTATGYLPATNLVPGYGYWINMSDSGNITIPDPPLSKGSSVVAEYIKEDWGKITITDNAGRSYTLYAVNGAVDLDKYELPPMPPSGMFDIRYGSGRIAEDINSSIQSIEMSGLEYPITVKVENMDIRLQDETGNEINENIKSGEEITISNTSINKLMVTGELIPDVYALEQNYPNPFNPSTTIEFSLPEDVNNVQLTIYDILGQRVTQLVNTSLKAGKYSYQWNAGHIATGMYIYELRTDKFVSVKKMMLLK